MAEPRRVGKPLGKFCHSVQLLAHEVAEHPHVLVLHDDRGRPVAAILPAGELERLRAPAAEGDRR